jgi:pyruvate dehydrogenase E2 component (dihydrolipoamide acetyltransferase)
MRKAIAAAMARSKREIPHYYLRETIDFEPASEFVAATNAERSPEDRLLPAVLLIKAVAHAVKDFPAFNGFYRDGEFQQSADIHIGSAIALRGGGLIAPAIHNADSKSLDEIMAMLRDLVERTRRGRLRSSELSDPTVTVTALGERGVGTVFGIIYPPQVAIVGFGRPQQRPWVKEGKVTAGTVVEATLAADHRVTDGHKGAVFLARIGRLLQEPKKL